jgi:hypothetical protein
MRRPRSSTRTWFTIAGAGILLVQLGVTQVAQEDGETPASAEGIEYFERHIRPVLVDQCYSCHGEQGKAKGGLRLTDRESLLAGGFTEEGVVPGDADASLLIQALRWDDPFLQMPPLDKLSDATVKHFEEWVTMGAPWPGKRASAVEEASIVPDFDLAKRKAQHWCWQPIQDPPIPPRGGWGSDWLDAFIDLRHRELGLHAAEVASKRTYIRRVTYDLIGLPPAPAEIAEFLADDCHGAKAKLVDRLLASPRFGEHWATHWLDRVRYSESLGHEFDFHVPGAHYYRDYLVRALNADVPYDRMVAEHIAGDLLEPRRDPETGLNESPVATGFWWLGEQTHSPVDVLLHTADKVDNQIDVFSKAFQGVTVACARCHDHMFDAISQRDYYSLQSILRSSRYSWVPVDERDMTEREMGQGRWAPLKLPPDYLWTLRDQGRELVPMGREILGNDEPVNRPTDGTWDEWHLGSSRADGWEARGLPMSHIYADQWGSAEGRDAAIPQPRVHTQPAIDTGFPCGHVECQVRSPEASIDRRYVHVLTAGKGSRLRVVVDGFQIIRAPLHGQLLRWITNEEMHWQTFDMNDYLATSTDPHRFYIELSNASVPDPAAKDNGHTWEFEDNSWFCITRMVTSDHATPPESSCHHPVRLGVEGEDVDGKYAAAFQKHLDARADRTPSKPVWRPAMVEGTPHNVDVHLRGNVHRFGETAPRQNLTALVGEDHDDAPGSGRMHLVETICTPDNPLTARVGVNRIWHHLFGRGIVATTDNFGVLGELPSHPELLDHLATRFIEGDWSQKGMIRAIVLSSTYGQSSVAGDDMATLATEVDPLNSALHRFPLKRLSGEQLRDAMLDVSGRLDATMGGESVPIHLTDFMQGRGRPGSSGPLDGANRRTLYVAVRRNFLSPFLQAFDRPAPFSCVGRRNTTNVPAQALILLNDPLVVELSGSLGERVRTERESTSDRIEYLFDLALGRPPRVDERERVESWLQGDADNPTTWKRAAHLVLNLKAFRWID